MSGVPSEVQVPVEQMPTPTLHHWRQTLLVVVKQP